MNCCFLEMLFWGYAMLYSNEIIFSKSKLQLKKLLWYYREIFCCSLQDILYLDSEVARTPKDLETEFEDKDNPFEREDPPPRQTAKPPVQPRDVKQPENASNGLMGWFTSNFKSAHTFEKLAADDTRYECQNTVSMTTEIIC